MGFMLMRGRGWPAERAAPPPRRPTSSRAGRLPRSRDRGACTVGRWAVARCGGWEGLAGLEETRPWQRAVWLPPSVCLHPLSPFRLLSPSSFSFALHLYRSYSLPPFENYCSLCQLHQHVWSTSAFQTVRSARGSGTRGAEYGDAGCVPRGSGQGSKPSSGWESGRKRHLS